MARLALTLISIGVMGLLMATPLQAATIQGINPILSGSNGQLYIPLSPTSSFSLGDPISGGGQAGMQASRFTLYGAGASTGGQLELLLTYQVPASFDPATAAIQLLVNDIDFLPQNLSNIAYLKETMALYYLDNVSDVPGTANLTIDQSNYGKFRSDGYGATNNTQVVYNLNLMKDLGLTNDQLNDINADHEFGIYVRLRSSIDQFTSGRYTYLSTPETIRSTMTYAVPEPMAVLTLLAGLPMVMKKRRNRK